MSDVEMILEQNYERRKWADELVSVRSPEKKEGGCKGGCKGGQKGGGKGNGGRRCRILRSTQLLCAMFAGGGAAFAGMGLALNSIPASIIGGAIGLAFLLTGALAEKCEADELAQPME